MACPSRKYNIMRGFLFILLTLPGLLGEIPATAKVDGGDDPVRIEDVQDSIPALTVFAGRAGQDTPVPHTIVRKEELRARAVQASVPMALDMEPSVVTTNEGGTGLGYSQMRIRGVAGGQTAVSLNGISLNGAEDGEVFWVNIPALGRYLSSVQLQRGLGTGACGPGAFGAGINMSTEDGIESISAELSLGSFDTWGAMIQAPLVYAKTSKGVITAGGAYAIQHTNGYIRNAFADVQSALGLIAWDGGIDQVGLTVLFGQQHSGITWEGESLEMYGKDPKYNPAGEYFDAAGYRHYYDNQSDNYRQLHLQLNWKHNFSQRLKSSTTLNYTDGYGYYEQYRTAFLNDSDAITKDALDNGLYVLRSDIIWQSQTLALSGGIYASWYAGRHEGTYGSPSATSASYAWYSNDADKYEADAYVRAEWSASKDVTLYGEMQGRAVHHNMIGPDEYAQNLDFHRTWVFGNPRIGATIRTSTAGKFMASAALGHREPTRSDLQASTETRPESMVDIETSYSLTGKKAGFSIGIYDMEYFDMLLETGRINDAGYVIKENTPRAYRRGVELSASWKPSANLSASANFNISTNRIRKYTAFLDCYDAEWNYLGQTAEEYANVPILLSPSAIAGAALKYSPAWINGGLTLKYKHVGRQYWDNTGNSGRMVPSYSTLALSAAHSFNIRKSILTIAFEANNILDRQYYAYAWVWRAIVDGKPYQTEGVFPQAPFNSNLTLRLAF